MKDVGYFLYRMRLTHSRFGVILCRKGITGSKKKETAARSLVRKAFHEDGSICIVIDHDDIERLSDTQTTLWALLLERIESVRFGRPK